MLEPMQNASLSYKYGLVVCTSKQMKSTYTANYFMDDIFFGYSEGHLMGTIGHLPPNNLGLRNYEQAALIVFHMRVNRTILKNGEYYLSNRTSVMPSKKQMGWTMKNCFG